MGYLELDVADLVEQFLMSFILGVLVLLEIVVGGFDSEDLEDLAVVLDCVGVGCGQLGGLVLELLGGFLGLFESELGGFVLFVVVFEFLLEVCCLLSHSLILSNHILHLFPKNTILYPNINKLQLILLKFPHSFLSLYPKFQQPHSLALYTFFLCFGNLLRKY